MKQLHFFAYGVCFQRFYGGQVLSFFLYTDHIKVRVHSSGSVLHYVSERLLCSQEKATGGLQTSRYKGPLAQAFDGHGGVELLMLHPSQERTFLTSSWRIHVSQQGQKEPSGMLL